MYGIENGTTLFLFFVFLLELISFCYTLEEDGARSDAGSQGRRALEPLTAWTGLGGDARN